MPVLTNAWRQAIEDLDALEGHDGEALHDQADRIILDRIPVEVFEAYQRVVDRADFWAHA